MMVFGDLELAFSKTLCNCCRARTKYSNTVWLCVRKTSMAASTLPWYPVIELKTCVYHIYSQDFNHSMPKSSISFAIVPLIDGFLLLQIFTGKPNNSTFGTKHFACFLPWFLFLCFFFSFFPTFFLSLNFFFSLIIVSSLQTELEVALFSTSEVLGDLCCKSQSCLKAFITLEGAVPNVYVLSEGSD